MKYCYECGGKLQPDFLNEREGMVPHCSRCGRWQFEVFSVAVSMIVVSPDSENILLIQQYGKKDYILVAGYINRGESAEEAAVRELREEIGLEITALRYNKSAFFAPSNTLMINYICHAADTDLGKMDKSEVDTAVWMSREQAIQAIKPDSLARRFLLYYLDLP